MTGLSCPLRCAPFHTTEMTCSSWASAISCSSAVAMRASDVSSSAGAAPPRARTAVPPWTSAAPSNTAAAAHSATAVGEAAFHTTFPAAALAHRQLDVHVSPLERLAIKVVHRLQRIPEFFIGDERVASWLSRDPNI
eukprot:CAMPEP_0117569442 /NCGR_PEP_ID=MMETSP0784-20121206/58660_1 /TAXON_ID=39447 /ORGANISM="" /LENGTH=136 /DNA_ID=CAMNT_0005367415 /DNA_START=40 /DNA_END=451 /DNA_ORIENTATION=-